MRSLGFFKKEATKEVKHFDIDALRVGVNDAGNHFIKLNNERQVDYVIDKVCNHAGGRLILKEGKAVCPMHGWQLDLDNLIYNHSHVCKEKLAYELNDSGQIVLNDYKSWLVNPCKTDKTASVTLRWLNHATVYMECNGISMITDPWLFGPAFMTGWWLANPSPEDSIELLKQADYVFISHNHPDHLHVETLSVLPKDTNIIVADFSTKSSEKYLQALGFEHITPLPFNEIFELTAGFQISVLKSGDFRDDSGIYICANGHEFLLTVDCNFLNSYILPRSIDLLMTSFASGATGFPLCFDNYSEEEKSSIIKRNSGAVRFSVNRYLEATSPRYYMPYAGMFEEYALRDRYISEHNTKNVVNDYKSLTEKAGAQLIEPVSDQQLMFKDGVAAIERKAATYLFKEDTNFYIDKLKEEHPYNAEKIIEYLKKSGYRGKQIVQVIPTDDSFAKVTGTIVFANFWEQVYKTIEEADLISIMPGYRVMKLKVRAEVFMSIVEYNLPWEDFSIGFQMRVVREPNVYESDFWYHFTNNYIGAGHYRFSSLCGACTVVNQNPIWITPAS